MLGLFEVAAALRETDGWYFCASYTIVRTTTQVSCISTPSPPSTPRGLALGTGSLPAVACCLSNVGQELKTCAFYELNTRAMRV